MSTVIEVHKEITEEHFDNYKEYYKKKNFPKASEFLWGTLNALYYAIGSTYGKKLTNYASIKNFIPTLIQDYNLDNIKDQYSAAETLHANFYHNFMSEDLFEHYKNKVIELILKLYDILEEREKQLKEVK